VPLAERVAAQHVRANQIEQRKIVWQATPLRGASPIEFAANSAGRRPASVIARVFLDLQSNGIAAGLEAELKFPCLLRV
jgi:hypothetical protein